MFFCYWNEIEKCMAIKVNHQSPQLRLQQIEKNYNLHIVDMQKTKNLSLKCAIFWGLFAASVFPFSVSLAGGAGIATAGHLLHASMKEMDVISLKTMKNSKMIVANRISQEKFDDYSRVSFSIQRKCWKSLTCLCGTMMLYGASKILSDELKLMLKKY